MKKNLYKWHRRISLIIAIPVVLWALSGFMHPIMTNIRPNVATQYLSPTVIQDSKIKISLKDALAQNKVAQFHGFRLVHIDINWFYQVQESPKSLPLYLSTLTGKKLFNGDEIYAKYIAKQFLDGQPKQQFDKNLEDSLSNKTTNPTGLKTGTHDCCEDAANYVLQNENGSKITEVKRITNFDDEYKFISRLLPAYKVSFDRPDGIRIYVETTSDRFGFAVDNKRAAFDAIFLWFHTWTWMDSLGNAKYYIMILLLSMTMFTTGVGIYLFFITKTKKPNGNSVAAARTNHRWVSISISIFTLMFSFSGAYHAISKFETDNRYDFFNKQIISTSEADLNLATVQKAIQKPITNISIVKINNIRYWQVFTKEEWQSKNGELNSPRKDLMKDKKVAPPNATYLKADDYSVLKNGEKEHAQYLATLFSKNPPNKIIATEAITKFNNDYNFTDKRLPVWKVSYASNHKERYYIETSTGVLSVKVDDTDLYEGYSFALLHKHHFMDFGGKGLRDFSTMFWAMAQIAVVTIGLIFWRKASKKKRVLKNS